MLTSARHAPHFLMPLYPRHLPNWRQLSSIGLTGGGPHRASRQLRRGRQTRQEISSMGIELHGSTHACCKNTTIRAAYWAGAQKKGCFLADLSENAASNSRLGGAEKCGGSGQPRGVIAADSIQTLRRFSMQKKIIALAVASAAAGFMSAPVFAQSNVRSTASSTRLLRRNPNPAAAA